ncbi:MAG TPA: glycosyltransferase [Solirubrobacteraceae bacterium]|nr:glycosyltransferase [Solirubrobacteraceae bacterium]
MARRVLIVAYYFPPLGGVGSLRALGFARHLPEHGWETEVLAPRAGEYHRDSELRFAEERVVRTGSLELSRLGKRALRVPGSDGVPAPVAGVRGALRRAAHTAVYFPDAQVGWAPFALPAGRRALRERPADAIVSTSFPITAHVVARRLAREAGIPWVADFRDPWSAMMRGGGRRRMAARLERSLARDASAVVMTSPSWAAHHARIWGRAVDVVPNGHDDGAVRAADRPPGLVAGYLGTYYPVTQAPLAAAWAALAREPGLAEVRVIGELHPAMRAELDEHGLMARVRVTGFLPQSDALAQLASCSLALLAGPADADGILAGQVAGKIWEYLATDLPVLYVGPTECDAARLLREQDGAHVVATGDAAGAAAAVRATAGGRHPRDTARFSRRARAAQLAGVLARVG